MFKGYCVVEIMGQREQMPPVKLSDVEACVNYVMLQKQNVQEVIVEDEDDYCILHAIDGKIVFPEQFKGR